MDLIWNAYLRWTRLDLPPLPLRDRVAVVTSTLPLVLKRDLVHSVVETLHSRLPVWVALARCRRRRGGWYEIPNHRVAVHVGRRIAGVEGIREGYMIRVEHGRATAIGWVDDDGKVDFEAL